MNSASDDAPRIISRPGLEWLVLPGEAEVYFTNFGDGRECDASELVAKVNADSALNLGHSDWRLPTIDELKTLIGTADAPSEGWFWSSSPFGNFGPFGGIGSPNAWLVSFSTGGVYHHGRSLREHVRFVRAVGVRTDFI
jgi:hypothetical protein